MIIKNISSFFTLQIVIILLFVGIMISGCKEEDNPPTGATHLELTINANQQFQTMHGFGASDAWSCQFIGKNWPIDKKEQIADWLFSRELDANENPKGIGLNTWRFNIGGGSSIQGAGSGISDEWRRGDSFMTGPAEYNWSRHEGQRWFMKAAKQRGVDNFIGFVNSPPVFMTKNNKAYSSSSSRYNLSEEKYVPFAAYLADVVEQLEILDGIKFKHISPFNEPQWDWTSGSQEGTPAQNEEIASLSRIIDSTFIDRNITTLIEIPEAAQFEFLYKDYNKAGRGNQVEEFFDPSSSSFIGDLALVDKKIAAHSYYSTWPLNSFTQIRKDVALAVDQSETPIELSMTEYCVLENNSEIKGSGRDLGMDAALYSARVMMADLVLANAVSWQWWLGISPYDYKDGLVYTDYNKNDGGIYDSKTLWAFGNFSRFVKEGMIRLGVSRSDLRSFDQTLEGILSSAFISEDSLSFTVVIMNYSTEIIPVKINTSQLQEYSNLKSFLTSGKAQNDLINLGKFDPDEIFDMPPRSIISITNQY